MEKLGDLIATPTGHGTIFITFNSKVRDQEQVIGVYTSGRSNYHVIIAESTNELDKIVYDMFHYDEDADIFETWCWLLFFTHLPHNSKKIISKKQYI